MHTSVRALLHQIVDYAGLFPPAKLPLDAALNIYLDAKQNSPHRWILGRFVCPTTRLPELLTRAKAHPDGSLLRVSALGQQAATEDQFLDRLSEDMQAIDAFRSLRPGDAGIDVIEVALPKGEPIVEVALRIPRACEFLDRADLHGYFEIPAAGSWKTDVELSSETLGHLIPSPGMYFGLKLRCGGVTAQACPSDEQVAFFIERCRLAKIPWKATAGLHHPRRHWDASLNVWHHGFLNVFLAGVLAHVHSLTADDLVPILADRPGEFFRFDEDSISWKDWTCTTEQITEARADFATTFGSCSFEEPCADLFAMGLLAPV